MQRLIITKILWLAIGLAALGRSVEIPVTPTSLDTYAYVFAVDTNATQGGIAFQITITAKTDDIDTNIDGAGLAIVTHTESGGGLLISAHSLDPAIPITLKREKRIWTAYFNLSAELLSNPDLYFTFNQKDHRMLNGKSLAMPSMTCYQIRLEDFTGRIAKALGGRWQTASGDTYEFTDDGTYEHWLQIPAISKSGEADASGQSNRIGMSDGRFAVNGNFLFLTRNDGANLTNRFYITKTENDSASGKFFGKGYSFIIVTQTNISQFESRTTISTYELMYQ
jgi:hypothetical protein